MIYTIKQYQEKYLPEVHVATVKRRAMAGNLPSNHFGRKLGHDWIIVVGHHHDCKQCVIGKSGEQTCI